MQPGKIFAPNIYEPALQVMAGTLDGMGRLARSGMGWNERDGELRIIIPEMDRRRQRHSRAHIICFEIDVRIQEDKGSGQYYPKRFNLIKAKPNFNYVRHLCDGEYFGTLSIYLRCVSPFC